MKTAVKLVLMLFMLFLVTPTVVGCIKKTCDTSVFYSMSEEEQLHSELKEIKGELRLTAVDFFKISKLTSNVIISENQLKHDKVTASIFSPPPNV